MITIRILKNLLLAYYTLKNQFLSSVEVQDFGAQYSQNVTYLKKFMELLSFYVHCFFQVFINRDTRIKGCFVWVSVHPLMLCPVWCYLLVETLLCFSEVIRGKDLSSKREGGLTYFSVKKKTYKNKTFKLPKYWPYKKERDLAKCPFHFLSSELIIFLILT